MSSTLRGIKIAVLGGDHRELYLIPRLSFHGAEINVVGLPFQETEKVRVYEEISEAVKGVQAIVLPMPGTDEYGKIRSVFTNKPLILTEDIMEKVPKDTIVIIGTARPIIKEMALKYQLKLFEIANMDDVAILNSIPSAEGAIQMAMEGSNITIHGSKSIVLGFGRCGASLARMLAGIGAKTVVAARKQSDLARITEMGLESLTYQELPDKLKEADFIFNTVPKMVMPRELVEKTNPEACIIDIASTPGGVDFKAAEDMGIKAVLAPGLPGKVAPKTAGLILSKVIPRLIIEELSMISPGNES